MTEPADVNPPILRDKRCTEDSAFSPDSLLREARRQRRLDNVPVPRICILDPDGDLVRWLEAKARATRDADWACYHTALYRFAEAGLEFGVVPFAAGSSFAVLVAEELFACGCEVLISMTSAGQLAPKGHPPYFILIERALRDEGTSYHYPTLPVGIDERHLARAIVDEEIERIDRIDLDRELDQHVELGDRLPGLDLDARDAIAVRIAQPVQAMLRLDQQLVALDPRERVIGRPQADQLRA